MALDTSGLDATAGLPEGDTFTFTEGFGRSIMPLCLVCGTRATSFTFRTIAASVGDQWLTVASLKPCGHEAPTTVVMP